MSIIVSVQQPLWYANQLNVADNISEKIDSYTHKIGADVGYDTMSFGLVETQPPRQVDWLNRLGYHITVKDEALNVIWQGFINEVEIDLSGLQLSIGPMLNISNYTNCQYQTYLANTNPPEGGVEAETGWVSDADSISRYGQLESIISGGQGNELEVDDLVALYLEENKNPPSSQNISISRSGSVSLSINCVGYYHLFNRYHYSYTATAGDINLSTKISRVVAASPTVTFTENISTTTIQVNEYEDGTNDAESIIKDLVVKGDTSNNRYIFGVYTDQTVVYEAVSTSEIDYYYKIDDNSQALYRSDGTIVRPWNVLPGRWAFASGVEVGAPKADLRDDYRAIFIESVSYTMPDRLSISGGKVSTLKQKLAQLGLGGM